MQCVTLLEICQVCCTVQVVGSIIMMPVWRSVPHHFNVLAGSVLNARCARPAGTFE